MGQNMQKSIVRFFAQWFHPLAIATVCGLMLVPTAEYWSWGELLTCCILACICIVSLLLVILGKCTMRLTWLDICISLSFLYIIANAYVLSTSSIAHLAMQISTCFSLYFSLRILMATWQRNWNAIVFFLATIGSIQAALGVVQLLNIGLTPTHDGTITGTFSNPGPYGCFISIILSICTSHYVKYRNKFLRIAIILMLVMLPASWSRTAFVAYGIILLLLFRRQIMRHWPYILCIVIPVIAGAYFFKRGSADSRVLMNIISIQEWQKMPWLGHGVGNFIPTLAQGQMNFFTVHPDSDFVSCVGTTNLAFNEYLRIAVEQGSVGLGLFFAIIILVLWHLYRRQSPLAYGIIALCIVAMFSYAFTLFPFLLLLVLFAALAARDEGAAIQPLAIRGGVIGVMALCVGLNLFFYRIVDAHIKANKHSRCFFVEDYYDMLPYKTDNREFLFKFGKKLREMKRYNDSNAILRISTRLDTDPMPYIVMGRNYEDMGMTKEADSLYQSAFHLQPNRIYPLYRQMKLYEAQRDTLLCLQKAEEIRVLRTKIESPAVQQMKHEADSIKNKAILPAQSLKTSQK